MQETSSLYRSIISQPGHGFEVSLVIGERGVLLDTEGSGIVFGSGRDAVRILVDSGGPDDGFKDSDIVSIETTGSLLPDDNPSAGNAISRQIDVAIIEPVGAIPERSRLALYTRAVYKTQKSEWIQKGVFFVDTRETETNISGYNILKLHGYDVIAASDIDFPFSVNHSWPAAGAVDTTVLQDIAKALGCSIDERTWDVMTKGYRYPNPVGYSCREMLRFIAGSYGGNFITNDFGELLLVQINSMPAETNLLIDELGDVIVFGESPEEEVRILV